MRKEGRKKEKEKKGRKRERERKEGRKEGALNISVVFFVCLFVVVVVLWTYSFLMSKFYVGDPVVLFLGIYPREIKYKCLFSLCRNVM